MAFDIEAAKKALEGIGSTTSDFLKGCIDEAEKSKKIISDLNETIKSTGDITGITIEEVSKMSNELIKVSTFSKEAIESGQSMLLTFNNIGKNVFPAASQAMIDMAQKMGTEPVEASKILGKALDNPTQGINDLIDAGVKFTEEQKKQIEVMQNAGDTVGAQKVILNELNKEFGGQASAAANTYSGKLNQLSNAFSSIKTSIGSNVLPYVNQASEAFKVLNTLFPGLSGIGDIISKLKGPMGLLITALAGLTYAYTTNLGGFKSFVDTSIPKIGETFKFLFNVIQQHGPLIKTILAGIIGGITAFNIYDTVKKAIDAFRLFKTALNDVKSAFASLKVMLSLTSPIAIIVIAIGALIGVIVYLWNTNAGFRNAVIGIWSNIKSVFVTVINNVKSKFSEFTSFLNQHKTAIRNIAIVLATIFGPALIKTGIEAGIAGAKIATSFISNIIKTGIQAVATGAKLTASFAASMAKAGLSAVVNGAKVTVSFIGAMIKTSAQAAITAGAITGKLIKSLASYALSGWKSVASIGAQTIAWVAQKAVILAGVIATGAMTAAQWALNVALNANPIALVILAIAALVAIGITMYKNWDTISAKASKLFSNISSVFSPITNLIQSAWKWGSDMIDGFINGIKESFPGLTNAITGIADGIKSFLHFSVPDKGPLTDYETWMPDFMKGMGHGIKVNTHLVTDPVKDLSVGIKTSMNKNLAGGTSSKDLKSTGTAKDSSSQNGIAITIAKLADSIIVREENDIDKIATALANKLSQTALGMG